MSFYPSFGFGGFNLLFGLFPVLFIAVLAFVIFIIAKSVSQQQKNNNAPRLTVYCVVASKRTEVTTHSTPVAGDASGAHGFHTMTDTSYYVTFQVESGDRIELAVSGSEYGQLSEGDQGKMSFQGTRYLGFERRESAFSE